jgi:hypothetical protein
MQIERQSLPETVVSIKAKIRQETLPDGTPYFGATYYEEGMDLSGLWQVTVKKDGIRVIRDSHGTPCSRAGNPVLKEVAESMPVHISDAELFRTDWSTSMSLKADTLSAITSDWYSLDPVDNRLVWIPETQLTHEYLMQLLAYTLEQKQEGLVIRQGDMWLKVVPYHYADLVVTGWIEGKGRHAGTFGAFTTHYGSVGGGFSDELRNHIWQLRYELVGKVIQVAYREKYPKTGKLRFPVFQCFRFDKTSDSV